MGLLSLIATIRKLFRHVRSLYTPPHTTPAKLLSPTQKRDRHQPFEIYKLVDENYQLQIGEPL
ncbi:hypothetical protein OGM63_02520 [Plectonema radiosum NIES-515]|uniref:Uncharacterized protein n=1 Tax=Plectonema radiosum NIES-515 TaxID=2986073 RepID=A0ABT3ATF9_9CYAN|nr:hypothetical protein [Plectonema radiosum]MCV3212414.1 hypothetical protein [Plectonema radiosum NIES-515]